MCVFRSMAALLNNRVFDSCLLRMARYNYFILRPHNYIHMAESSLPIFVPYKRKW